MTGPQRRSFPWRVVQVLILGVLILVAAGLVWAYRAGTVVTWHRAAPSADGSVLRIDYTTGACHDGAAADVEQTPTTVTITVRSRDFPESSCNDSLVRRTIEITLEDPVGERTLVDGACLLERFHGRDGCRDGGERIVQQ
jgi:hypothetical protein